MSAQLTINFSADDLNKVCEEINKPGTVQVYRFGLDEKYPHTPGWKKVGTSSEAAHAVKSKAATLREKVLRVLSFAALTADEVAQRIDESVLSVRPRLSELSARGMIEETGQRRRNASGKMAAVWRAAKCIAF